jgi:hypothetical protein
VCCDLILLVASLDRTSLAVLELASKVQSVSDLDDNIDLIAKVSELDSVAASLKEPSSVLAVFIGCCYRVMPTLEKFSSLYKWNHLEDFSQMLDYFVAILSGANIDKSDICKLDALIDAVCPDPDAYFVSENPDAYMVVGVCDIFGETLAFIDKRRNHLGNALTGVLDQLDRSYYLSDRGVESLFAHSEAVEEEFCILKRIVAVVEDADFSVDDECEKFVQFLKRLPALSV